MLINKSMKIASETDEGIIMRRVYNRWIVPFLLISNGRKNMVNWFTRLDIVIKGLVAQLKILAILLHLELVLIIIHPLFVLRSELRSVHRSIRKRIILFSSLEPLSIFQFCVYKINRIFLFLKSLLQFPNSSYEENPSRLKSNLLHDYMGI